MSRKTRKLIWSAPLVAVFAVAGALAMFMTLQPGGVLAHVADMHGPPAAVTMVTAEPADDDANTPAVEGQTMVSIKWRASATTGDNASDAATHYRIDRSDDTRVWTQIEPSLADADVACDSSVGANYRCHMDTGLEPNKTYYYRVFAMNEFGISAVSVDDTYDDVTTEAVGAPMAVRNLDATTDQEKQIDLTWHAPADDGGADILFYCIVVATADGTLTDLADDSADANAACKEIAAASTDDQIEDLTQGLQVALGATIAAATETDEGVIVIRANDDDGNPVTSFEHTDLDAPDVIRLRYRMYAVNSESGKMATIDDREISASITNTADGRTIADAIDPGDELKKPAAPTNLRAAVRTDDGGDTNPQVRIYWTVPDSHPTNAELAEIDDDATRNIEVTLWDGDSFEPIADGEISCQAHADGALTPNTAAPAQCVITSATLTTDTTRRSNTYRVRYVIDDNGDATDGTMIEGDDARISVSLPLTADNEQQDLPLILATGDTGFVAASDLRFRHNPNSPKTAIDLLWQRNANAEDDNPTGYVVEYSTDDGITWKTLRNADSPRDLGTNTIYTHSGVEPGKKYTYRVFPWHNSAYGLPKTIEASSEAADEPGPVRNLTVTAVGEDALKLDWDAPSHNGGHKVMGYVVQVSTDVDNNTTNEGAKGETGAGQGQWTSQSVTLTPNAAATNDPFTTDADTTEWTYRPSAPATPLTAGSLRWFRVIAITLENDGLGQTGGDELADNYSGRTESSPLAADISAAMEVSGITDAIDDPSATPADQAPGAPVGLTAEPSHSINLIARTDRGVLLIWNEPEQTPQNGVTSYVIQRQVVGTDTEWQDEGQVTWTGDDDIKKRTSYVDTENPEDGEVRKYRVGSKNIAGTTWADAIYYPASHAEDHALPMLTSPMLEATAGTGSVTLMWDEQDVAVEYTVWGVRPDGSAVRAGSTDPLIRMDDITDNSYEVTGLMSGEEYWFAVTACEMADCGAGNYLHSNVAVATPD